MRQYFFMLYSSVLAVVIIVLLYHNSLYDAVTVKGDFSSFTPSYSVSRSGFNYFYRDFNVTRRSIITIRVLNTPMDVTGEIRVGSKTYVLDSFHREVTFACDAGCVFRVNATVENGFWGKGLSVPVMVVKAKPVYNVDTYLYILLLVLAVTGVGLMRYMG